MNPAEHLRAVARRGLDDEHLAVEAAGALSGFASDPAGLVVACRRLLAHRGASGPLWWLAARVLAAPDPVAACREAVRLLDADRTAERLAAALPLVGDDEVVAVVGWPMAADRALAERLDLPVVAIRTDGADPAPRLRRRLTDRGVRVLDVWDAATLVVARLLVPAHALGGGRALVPAGTAEVLDELGTAGRDGGRSGEAGSGGGRAGGGGGAGEVWLLGGVGRVLPARLVDAVAEAVARTDDGTGAGAVDDPPVEWVPLARFDRVAGPRGVESPEDAVARLDCTAVPELLDPHRF